MPKSARPRKSHNRKKTTAPQNMALRPHPFHVFRTFQPIISLLIQLRRDEVYAERGKPIMQDWSGEWMEIGPAMEGWHDCWIRIIRGEGLDIDVSPIKKLARWLANGVPIPIELVEQVQVVTEQCMKAYAQIPRERSIRYSRDECIQVEIDKRGLSTGGDVAISNSISAQH